MKLKAKLKWNKERVYVKPVFFSWHVGLQYKCVTGYKAGSIFCDNRDKFIFPLQTELIMMPIKIWYWLRYYLYMYLRHWLPNRIKRRFQKRAEGDLPF
jgi:hypothetical protein